MKRLILALAVVLGMAAGLEAAQASPGGRFMLRAHDGRIVKDEDFLGRFMLIYFGYTFCPDVCPTSLNTMAGAIDLLGDDAEILQPLFITVDPERDTQEVLGDYVAAFHPSIIGLTGPREFVDSVIERYGVKAEKVPLEDSDTYLMDHTSSLFLMGPDGGYIERFPHTMPPDELAERLREHIRAVE